MDSLLRYRISDWHQLVDCKSNNSRKLHIQVSDFIQNDVLKGVRILLNHDDFGVLFACVINSSGMLLDPVSKDSDIIYEMCPYQIICELQKYGFLIHYAPAKHLSSEHLTTLIKLQGLNFDKIRILNVYEIKNGVKQFNWKVVGFKLKKNPYWLNADYSPSKKEYMKAVEEGTAIDVLSFVDKCKLDWTWLYGYVASISDILEENS